MYLSEQLGTQGFLAGAGLPSWKTDALDTSSLSSLDLSAADIMKTATSFIAWWDNILPAESAEAHKNLIAQLVICRRCNTGGVLQTDGTAQTNRAEPVGRAG